MYLFKKPFYHFSIDDGIEALLEISDKKIPLLEHPYFNFLYQLHKEYDVRISLYLFYKKLINGKWRTLKEVKNIRDQLLSEDKKPWIKFGPHALDFNNPPYSQSPSKQIQSFNLIYKEIDRFVGPDMHAKYVRLHRYSESFELLEYFKRKGVSALFSTDRATFAHRMPSKIKKRLDNHGLVSYKGMNFIRTQFRVEFFADNKLNSSQIIKLFFDSLSKYGFIIFYTHEYELARDEIKKYLIKSFRALKKLSITSLRNI